MIKDKNGSIRILSTLPLSGNLVQQITSIDRRIRLTDIFDLMMAELQGDASAREKQDAPLAEAEIIYGFGLPGDVINRAPKLKWIQMISAGADRYLNDDLRNSLVILTGVKGMHAVTIGEFVVGEMLMFAKGAPSCFQQKQVKQWKPFMPSVLHSKTVGIIGLGGIGREIARMSKAFSMKVLATYRSAKRAEHTRYVDEIYPVDDLTGLLEKSDFVVLALPLTQETTAMIAEKQLRSMKPTAFLINISRGRIIDEAALIMSLEEHWIAGAGLDVFQTEPLPADSRLWELPNVIFSPHIAGGMDNYIEQATTIFCENLKRYIDGKKLLRIVNKQRGY